MADGKSGNGSGHARRAPRRGRQVGGSSGGRVEIYDNNNRDGQIKHLDEDYFKALDEKHIRYDAEFSRHLMAKYFSGKAFDGGKVYDQETIIENETIKSSRYPFTSSFADPVRHYEEENRSASPAEENIKCTGKEHPSKKSS